MKTTIRKGGEIRIEAEWQNPVDDQFIRLPAEDEGGGRVRMAPPNADLKISQNQVVNAGTGDWRVESPLIMAVKVLDQ